MSLNLYYLPKRSSKEIWQDPLTSLARNAEASNQTDIALMGISSDVAPCSPKRPERFLSCHSRAGSLGSLSQVKMLQTTMAPASLLVYYVSSSEARRGNNAVGSVGFALQRGCAEQLRQDSGCEAGHARLACARLLTWVHRWPPVESVGPTAQEARESQKIGMIMRQKVVALIEQSSEGT